MANITNSKREQDTALFCGAVIKCIRENVTFSFQSLYTEKTGKKNPNKAYKLRDALIATEIIKRHKDGTYYLPKKSYDSTEVVKTILSYMKNPTITTTQEEDVEVIITPKKQEILLKDATLQQLTDAIRAMMADNTSYTINK